MNGVRVTLLGLFASMLVACGGSAEQRILHEEKGFAITAPADWIVEKDAFGIPLILRPPESRLAHVSVGIDDNRPVPLAGQVDPHDPELQRYATLKLERTGFLTAPAKVLARDSGQLNGHPVVRSTRSYRSGPVDYTARTYFLLGRNGDGFTLTAAAPTEDFDALASQFETVLESFELLPDDT